MAVGAWKHGTLMKQGVSWPLIPVGALVPALPAVSIMWHGSGGAGSGAGAAKTLCKPCAAACFSSAMPHQEDSWESRYQGPARMSGQEMPCFMRSCVLWRP